MRVYGWGLDPAWLERVSEGLFPFLMVSLEAQKISILVEFSLSLLFLLLVLLMSYLRKYCLIQGCEDLLLFFSRFYSFNSFL